MMLGYDNNTVMCLASVGPRSQSRAPVQQRLFKHAPLGVGVLSLLLTAGIIILFICCKIKYKDSRETTSK